MKIHLVSGECLQMRDNDIVNVTGDEVHFHGINQFLTTAMLDILREKKYYHELKGGQSFMVSIPKTDIDKITFV